MATLTIRNLPEELHAALKERALRNRRSLNQEVIAELFVAGAGETDEERHERVELEIRTAADLRSRATGFMSAAEIDAAKRAGRD